VKGFCGAPVGVDFKDTTADAASWHWNLDWTSSGNSFSTQQAFTHTYTENRLFNVLLKVTNTAGCTKEIYQTVNLPYPTVHIFYTQSSTNPPTASCGPITMKFGSSSTDPITQFRWEFGDGGTSTDAEPTHTFSTPGNYQVKLFYTTSNGCTGVAHYNSITIYRKPEADFKSLQGTSICGNVPVTFSSLTTGNLSGMNWYIDDNYVGQGNFSSITWRFEEAKKYKIKLIAFSGHCSDTAEKIDYIEVFAPFPKISGVTNTCDDTRGLVTVHQASKEAHSWKWDFGDGASTTLNADQPSISHTYTKSGNYKVVLTTTNGACSVRDSTIVSVMLKKDLTLTADASICFGSELKYSIGNLQDNPYPNSWNYNYYFAGFYYEDGTQFTGYNNNYAIDKWPNFGSHLSQPDPTKQQLRAVLVSDHFGCRDTTNFVPIRVVGSQAVFDMNDATVCFNSPVTFIDRSTTNGTTIKRWEWNFGDGEYITTTQPGNVSHSYPNPGIYYVSLRISDDKGCSSSTFTYTQYVTVTGPKAAFSPSGTNVPLNTTVNFYNYTNSIGAYNTTFEWDFGNGATSTAYSPSYTYTVAGTYTVKLRASDAVTGCSSEATQTIVVRDFNTAFNFNTSYITAQSCPPVLVRFNNTSINFTSVTWDFGDGIRVNNVNYPSHIYEKPGKYIITLYVYGPNGLKGTYTDSVVVQQPRATMQADDLEGCIGNIVTLHAKADSTNTYTWDFGDGYVVTTTDSFAAHPFKTPGTYTPSLLVKDANGCAASTTMTDKIVIRPDPVVNISPAQPIVCLGQGTTLQASGGDSYSWSPATGLSNSTVASPVANPAVSTTYTVQVADDIGCQGSGSVTVTVVQPVAVAVPPELSVCAGNSVTIPASGAVIYNWINNTIGLNDTHIANPTAQPGITTTYTVTGSDAHQCFTDTAEVTVRVLPLPVVDAGIDQEVQAGTPVNLAPTFSPDVVQWTWTPATYLNCSNCPNPISTPLAQTKYVLTVKNGVGCTAKDSLTIKMICDEARVAVPNAFTPNGDGHNDEFIIKGISVVKHLLIFNRWGQKVFERSNFIAADRSACWNGTLKGYPASEGTYVYFIEMECPGGGVFTRKGSFVLVR
jgi:gliding motility-associated-like protein